MERNPWDYDMVLEGARYGEYMVEFHKAVIVEGSAKGQTVWRADITLVPRGGGKRVVLRVTEDPDVGGGWRTAHGDWCVYPTKAGAYYAAFREIERHKQSMREGDPW